MLQYAGHVFLRAFSYLLTSDVLTRARRDRRFADRFAHRMSAYSVLRMLMLIAELAAAAAVAVVAPFSARCVSQPTLDNIFSCNSWPARRPANSSPALVHSVALEKVCYFSRPCPYWLQ